MEGIDVSVGLKVMEPKCEARSQGLIGPVKQHGGCPVPSMIGGPVALLVLAQHGKPNHLSDLADQSLSNLLYGIRGSEWVGWVILRSVVNFTVFLQKWPKFRHS